MSPGGQPSGIPLNWNQGNAESIVNRFADEAGTSTNLGVKAPGFFIKVRMGAGEVERIKAVIFDLDNTILDRSRTFWTGSAMRRRRTV